MDVVTATAELPWLGMPVWIWIGFIGAVIALLAFDLGVLHGKPHEVTVRESVVLSSIFISLGWLFAGIVGFVYFYADSSILNDASLIGLADPTARAWHAAQLYLTGLLVEQSLSIDNIFVISLVFSYFAIPRRYQHRVLFWGILGVIVMRGLMIAGGAALLAHFHWVLYIFGAFLLFTGLKMLFIVGDEPDIANNLVLKVLKKRMRVSDALHDERFFVMAPDQRTGSLVRHATPLFLALAVIECIDLVFAVDSVPAVFAITQEPFIVYTSNIFAILGLRSLYFALAAMVYRFHYLKYALALVLVFIGAKIFLSGWLGKFPPELSLGITLALLAGGILFSLWRTKAEKDKPSREAEQIGR
jgi:tellurite resistance protein TerC